MSKQSVKDAVIKAAEVKLKAYPPGEVLTSWPNKTFAPVNGLWASVVFVPVNDMPVTCGQQGENEVLCFLQIDVNVPTGNGDKEQNELLAYLENYFTAGQVVELNGQAAEVMRNDRAVGRVENSFWCVPLSIYFRARYQRPVL